MHEVQYRVNRHTRTQVHAESIRALVNVLSRGAVYLCKARYIFSTLILIDPDFSIHNGRLNRQFPGSVLFIASVDSLARARGLFRREFLLFGFSRPFSKEKSRESFPIIESWARHKCPILRDPFFFLCFLSCSLFSEERTSSVLS